MSKSIKKTRDTKKCEINDFKKYNIYKRVLYIYIYIYIYI